MQIYIGNLSAETTSMDLAQVFMGYGEDYPSFSFKYYQRGNKRFYFALTSIEPESLARKVIGRRNMKRIKGRSIVLHAYKDRALSNERRALNWRSQTWDADERRKTDRRHLQHDKVVYDTGPDIEPVFGQAQFW